MKRCFVILFSMKLTLVYIRRVRTLQSLRVTAISQYYSPILFLTSSFIPSYLLIPSLPPSSMSYTLLLHSLLPQTLPPSLPVTFPCTISIILPKSLSLISFMNTFEKHSSFISFNNFLFFSISVLIVIVIVIVMIIVIVIVIVIEVIHLYFILQRILLFFWFTFIFDNLQKNSFLFSLFFVTPIARRC